MLQKSQVVHLSTGEKTAPFSPQRGQTLTHWNWIQPALLTLRHLLRQERSLLKKERFCGKHLWASCAGGSWEQPCQAQRGSQHQESCSVSLNGHVVAPRIGVKALWLPQQLAEGERYPQPPARLLLLSLHGLSRDPEVTKLLI